MMDFWLAYSGVQKTLLIFAVTATVILLIQFILMLFGGGDHDMDADSGDFDGDFSGTDADFDGADGLDAADSLQHDFVPEDNGHIEDYADAGLRIFTVRGILTFFAVMGWTGLLLSYTSLPAALVILISTALGLVAMILMALLIRSMMKLSYIPEVKLNSMIGKTAEVYITIPANGEASGKIMVELGGSLREVDAVTDSEAPLKTGSFVDVTDIRGKAAVVEKQ